MTWLTRLLDRLADLYWRDPVKRARHQLEVDAMRYGGKITWSD